MPKYVALLRGINVGRHNRVAMADLRELLIGLGYGDVRTHLQSGNAIFTTTHQKPARLALAIEEALREKLELSVRCLIWSAKELRAVRDGNPLQTMANDGSKMLVLFLSGPLDPRLLEVHDPIALARDHIRVGERVVYQWCPDGFLAAPNVGAFVEKNFKVTVTARNWNTITRLDELMHVS